MIEKLKWDTDFFDFNVGKIELKSNTENELNEHIWNEIKNNYKLIYFFVSPQRKDSHSMIINHNGHLVDEKVTYQYKIDRKSEFTDIKNIELLNSSSPNLMSLAIQSGIHSRFRNDKNIPNSKFIEMYTIWINKSIEKKDVFVFGHYNKLKQLNGFATLKIDGKTGIIELIAVDNNSRGEGVGSNLLNYILHFSHSNKLNNILVSTQKSNAPACKFYEKNNFQLYKQVNIYHLWNSHYNFI